jgi:hypothetical protein
MQSTTETYLFFQKRLNRGYPLLHMTVNGQFAHVQWCDSGLDTFPLMQDKHLFDAMNKQLVLLINNTRKKRQTNCLYCAGGIGCLTYVPPFVARQGYEIVKTQYQTILKEIIRQYELIIDQSVAQAHTSFKQQAAG